MPKAAEIIRQDGQGPARLEQSGGLPIEPGPVQPVQRLGDRDEVGPPTRQASVVGVPDLELNVGNGRCVAYLAGARISC